MDNGKITFRMTLLLDKEWAENQDGDELINFVRNRLDYTLGFRGKIKSIRVIRNRKVGGGGKENRQNGTAKT
jgi:hypothetical protein